jgi:RES domain-containing protein
VPVIYTAESRSLASLEVLVHAEDTRLLAAIRWVAIPVEFDNSLARHPARKLVAHSPTELHAKTGLIVG